MFSLKVIRDKFCKKVEDELKPIPTLNGNVEMTGRVLTYDITRIKEEDNEYERISILDFDKVYSERRKDVLYKLANSIVKDDEMFTRILCIAYGLRDGDFTSVFALRYMCTHIELELKSEDNVGKYITGADKLYFIKQLINAYNIRIVSDCREEVRDRLLWSTQCTNISNDEYNIMYDSLSDKFVQFMSVTVLASLFEDNSYKKALDIKANNITKRFEIKVKSFDELNKLIDRHL